MCSELYKDASFANGRTALRKWVQGHNQVGMKRRFEGQLPWHYDCHQTATMAEERNPTI